MVSTNDKKTKNIYKTLHRKLKIELLEQSYSYFLI